ncbi:hypothetical protein J1N35_023134 [Gossypium stocksii]|uniref:Uncharacterized protein n=1 Tax=Gossypium stocksii TaxID=47602 RepID=A0A9D3VI88_9ROSI|nr:hypothetical protein J1N35_023134 [Gossypium stocksii]
MHKLWNQTRRKVGGSTYKTITRLQCRFISSVDPYKYELFDVISETHLETTISLHILSKNTVIELYVKFTNADRFGTSSIIVMATKGTKAKSKSCTTWLCGGFFDLLQSGYYDVPKTFMGRHTLVSGIDLNFGGYRRTDDLRSTVANEGTSNIVLEGDNEGPNEEGDAREEEGVDDTNKGNELEFMPIQ